jgi:3-oxoacyl-[acyl-carrier-protein] synthase-3
MQGKEVFRHAVEKLSKPPKPRWRKAGLTADDVDWIVPHQANLRIITRTAKKMGVGDGEGRGHRAGPRQHLRRVDPAGALGRGGRRAHQAPGDLLVAEAIGGGPGLGFGRPALVAMIRH